MVQSAFTLGFFDPRLAETLITLIPKGENPTHLRNFRPISLCNMACKVISKVLVNRLHPFLEDLIGPLQSSFIPHGSVTDNVIIT